ncbi:hypothetical protein AcW1_004611 [Taiwanofungus camphoratus]|nr:hypothetical protein AcV5_000997 [Antrodia cinnamomea]KAI0959938.1 hypothetical protein AcW1_004611 [Antrodia cinnamomea]
MWSVSFKRSIVPFMQVHSRAKSTLPNFSKCAETCGIPLQPVWSVNELLSSYPQPIVTPSTLKRLHDLSALLPPHEGTMEHARLTQDMENLVKLVEAVKLVDTSEVAGEDGETIPDGRIWAEGSGIEMSESSTMPQHQSSEAVGRELLQHSSRVKDGLYVVDANKTR